MWKFEEDHPFALAYRLVEEGKIDPWDVDISALAKAYVEEIRRLELLDLRAPASAVLAASFLLKKQAEVLFPTPKQKRERKRISLQEIVEQFQEQEAGLQEEVFHRVEKVKRVISKVSTKRIKKERKERKIPIHISRFEDALEELRHILKETGINLFLSRLVEGKSLVPYLMALLVLYQDGFVELYQEAPYEDIMIVPVLY